MFIEEQDGCEWISPASCSSSDMGLRLHPSGPSNVAPHPFRARVLIVDDDAMNQVALEGMLSAMGHVVVGSASDGMDALEMYKQLRPDIVLMDIVMPYMDGIQATKGIMEFDDRAIVLMVSVMGERHTMEKALAAGAKGFVVKPFRSARLDDKIVKLLIENSKNQINK